MTRTVEAIEGLALVGRGSFGELTIATPGLIAVDGVPGSAEVALLSETPAESGTRRYRMTQGPVSWGFRFEVPTPDLSPTSPGVRRDGPIAFVHGPLGPTPPARTGSDPPDLIVLSNARALFREGAPFIETLGALRRTFGARPVLWAPRVAVPHRVALLVYLGIDLLDPTEALVAAAEGRNLDPELGEVPAGRTDLCACGAGDHRSPDELRTHVVAALEHELRRARAAARLGRLRELAESRLPAEPLLAEMLRHADRSLADLLEQRAPVVATESRSYVLRESFRRPEAARFRSRFLARYAPPPSKSVLLLVPCSRTKPYRNSRSHRRFAAAWDGLPGTERLHVVSVTSPLGLVPRDLEDVPPARHYDIPVTGDWDESERAAVLGALAHLLGRGRYAQVVVHLDPQEYDFLRAGLSERAEVRWTLADDRTTTPEAVLRLRAALQAALGSVPTGPVGPLGVVKEELRSLAGFQMGTLGGEALLAEPLRLHGRPWFQRLSDGHGMDLASWREARGLFQITVGGGRRIGRGAGLTVEAAAGVDLRGDLFCPGVARADTGIRAGDVVVVYRGEELLGVGEAALDGPLMEELGRGTAVWVRHRAHPADASISSIEVPGHSAAGRSSSG